MLLMEPDLLPVKSMWLDALRAPLEQRGAWWVIGAPLRSSVGSLYRGYREQVCFYLPLHFKRILLTILTCPPHILTF